MQFTQEIKDFVAQPGVGKVLATVSADGFPNIGPKGTIQVYDDGSLAYCEFVGRHHYENAKANPKVAIACIDFAGRQGYRFIGAAEVVEAADELERLKDRIPLATRAKAVVLVRVSEVYGLGGEQVGQKIL